MAAKTSSLAVSLSQAIITPDVLATLAAQGVHIEDLSEEDKRFLVEHAGHDQQHAQMAIILICVIIGSQVVGLWLIPALLGFQAKNYRYIIIWIIFSILNGYVIKRSLERPLRPSTPRLVYSFYHWVYLVSWSVGVVGYLLIMVTILGIPSIVGLDVESAFSGGVILLFYGLYFGTLGRDIVDRVSDRMALNLGYYARVGFPAKNLMVGVCAICGDKTEGGPENSADYSSKYDDSDDNVAESEPFVSKGMTTVTLNCRHTFHEQCIRGWTIIGKKDCCPNCKEKVNLKAFSRNPWETSQLL
ncbi:hypothetical protein HK096_011131, partial [Nowakowskiella sp. JEL0078]